MAVMRHKEAIHSGHFMVSNFEAEAQDEDDIAVPVPEEASTADTVPDVAVQERVQNQFKSLVSLLNTSAVPHGNNLIDVSLTKLFQCMSIAYRQKLTSPKWNRFLGMKLRWKDKIRLNNVIWRCWHMQFIKGHRKLVCAFANPLEIDNHNKTEAGAIMEGKYWKRKMATILAEYKKWRIFYKNQNYVPAQDTYMDFNTSLGSVIRTGQDDIELESMITDADFFVDALFNSLGSQSVQFPDNNKLMRNSTNSDFIQPGLNHLQPHLDDLMDLDPMAPLQDWLSSKLPESVDDSVFLRGKSQTPDQESIIYPLQDIKDIEVMEASYHPFSHASLRDVAGYKSQSRSNQPSVVMMSRNTTIQAKSEFNHTASMSDSQPSTSTFSQYSNIVKRSAPLPGKKLWAIQEQMQGQSWESAEDTKPWGIKQWNDQTENKIKCPQPNDQGSLTYPSPITQAAQVRQRSVIQNHLYLSVDQGKKKSVIATNPMPKSPVPYHASPIRSPQASYTNFKSLTDENDSDQHRIHIHSEQQHIPIERTKHEPVMDRNSELVQLLQANQRKVPTPSKQQKLVQKPMKGLGKEGRYNYRQEEVAEDLSRSSGHYKKMLLIPPPPPGSLPQPAFTIGSSSSAIIPDDTKLSNAEQKRRCTIKNGFEFLRALVPSLSQTPNVKISKAALLTKGAEYVMQLKDERETISREVDQLRRSVDSLNQEISGYQAQLPTAGSAKSAAVSQPSQLQYLFEKHVATCTMQNWKYWVFSRLMQPLLETYDRTVSSSSMEDLSRTSGSWLDQHASLVQLRPLVLNSLKELSVNTEVLSEPHKMPQEALNSVSNISSSLTPKRETHSRQSSQGDGGIFYENHQ
eukprot:GFUD01006467.1.p1 GENE.GFUD01006467.1~~GFUD01006467.1.p1  ORF type:complete len:854 (-),score=169.48 GFUD01006467.1:652-3213(-)